MEILTKRLYKTVRDQFRFYYTLVTMAMLCTALCMPVYLTCSAVFRGLDICFVRIGCDLIALRLR